MYCPLCKGHHYATLFITFVTYHTKGEYRGLVKETKDRFLCHTCNKFQTTIRPRPQSFKEQHY